MAFFKAGIVSTPDMLICIVGSKKRAIIIRSASQTLLLMEPFSQSIHGIHGIPVYDRPG